MNHCYQYPNVNKGKAPRVLDELGRATTLALLLCLALLTWYLKVGKGQLATYVPPFYNWLILITLAILTVFTVGCTIHMIFLGDRSSGQLRKDLKRQTDELTAFINESNKRLRDYESLAAKYARTIRPRSLNNLNLNRRIVNALARRVQEVRDLLSTRNKIDLIDAHELLGKRLMVIENAMESLIGADPVPPLEPGQWFGTVEDHFREIEADLRRLAA